MIISRKHGFVFIKTRRTAGSSLEAWLQPYLGPQDSITGSVRDGTPRANCPAGITGHISSEKIRELFPDIPDSYRWFCVERNSYKKAVSDWLYHRDVIGDGYLDFKGHLNNTNISDWDRYSGEKGIQVLQFEQVAAFVTVMGVHLKSNKYAKPWQEYYDSATHMHLSRMFKGEIEAFRYLRI